MSYQVHFQGTYIPIAYLFKMPRYFPESYVWILYHILNVAAIGVTLWRYVAYPRANGRSLDSDNEGILGRGTYALSLSKTADTYCL